MERIKIDIHKEKGRISPELHSQFIEFLGACIYDGIWVGEDSEIPNYHGLRKDVVDALKEIQPPLVRWPGGCYADTYHWRDGIGPRDRRPITYNENFGTFEPDSNQFGTHEFMEFCRLIGAKPWFNINMMSGSVAEMREWMEYCNREDSTSLAAERKKNGSEEPFQVEYWGVGNEMWAGGGTMTAAGYAAEYRKYASAFPSFAKLGKKQEEQPKMYRIACGPDGNKPRERAEWTREFFKELSRFRQPILDGYDIHFYNWNIENPAQKETEYGEEDWYRVIDGCRELEEVILEQYRLVREGLDSFREAEGPFPSPEKKCDLIVGEWGNWHGAAFGNRPALYQQCTMLDAVTSALTLDIFHRNCEKVKAACVAQSVNVLNSLLLTEKGQCIRTPNYHVFDMYKVHRGGEALAVSRDSGGEEERINGFASRKGGIIYVNLVNTDMVSSRIAELTFTQAVTYAGGEALYSGDVHDCNTADQPDLIRKRVAEAPVLHGKRAQVILPPASVSVYTFALNTEKKD